MEGSGGQGNEDEIENESEHRIRIRRMVDGERYEDGGEGGNEQ